MIDSGSVGGSGSFLYDSLQDEFIFVHRGNSTNVTSSHFVLGPETYDSLGNETYLTTNTVPKGTGKEHLIDSCIIDNGTTVCVNATLKASGQVCSLMGNFGCIGVGTNTPITTLHISNSGNNFLTLERSTATNSKQLNINIESNSQTTISYDCVGGFVIGSSCNPNTQTGFNERLRISGNGIACFSCQVCAPSFIGGTMSGTTIYGSTAVCSPIGLFSGCVGIGTSSPITRLQVIANTPTFLYSPGQLDVRTQENQAANKGAMISIGGNAIGNNTPYNFGIIGAYKTNSTSEDYSSYMIFGTSDVYSNVFERMRITTGGNVGIGTCTPVGKLDINTGGNRNVVISNDSTDTEYNIISLNGTRTKGSYAGIAGGGTADNNLYLNSCVGVVIQTGASFTERMRITSTGDINMNTTSGSKLVTIKGQTGNGYCGELRLGNADHSAGIVGKHNASGQTDLEFWTECYGSGGYKSKMVITSGGNQFIFTCAPSSWVKEMYNDTATGPYGMYLKYRNGAPNGTSNPFLQFDDSSFNRFQVRSNGGIANFQSNDVNLSDERTKKDITPLDSYWDKFKNIEIVKFKYKDQTHDDFNIGIIAQQIETIAPEFVDVSGYGQTPEDGIPLKTVYTTDLYHTTIKVLQESMIKIETQQCTIQCLTNRIEQLENK
jgi:hypothetical protein